MEVRTYEKLSTFIDRWIAGTIDLLILESNPGLGKTFLIKEKIGDIKNLSVSAHTTPLAMYKNLYAHRNTLVWFDDITSLFLNRLNIAILMQLCESTKLKKLCYHSTSELLGNVPQEFTTTSKTLISCNFVEGSNQYLEALKDRAFLIHFNPNRNEILNKLQEVSKDYSLLEDKEKKEVLNLIKANSNNIKSLSLRTLLKGFALYRYHKLKPQIDWRDDFLAELGISDKLLILNELMMKFDNDKERLEHFPFSKPTFYAYKKMLS